MAELQRRDFLRVIALGSAGFAIGVDLHAADDFANQARWLIGEVDRLCPMLPPYRQRRCFEVFGRALELEIDFHHAPYERP